MRRLLIIGGESGGTGEVGFSPQTDSIDFDGASEQMLNSTEQPIGIADAWSIAIWWKPDATAFTKENHLLHFRPSIGGNLIEFRLRGATTNDPIAIGLAADNGSTLKFYTWDSLATQDAWNFDVFTWDGSSDTLTLYHDTTETAPTATPQDNSGTMANGNRQVSIGATISNANEYSGLIHSVGVWDTILTDAEQTELFNSGDGSLVDWSEDGTDYLSSSALVHWYRLGFNASDIGEDFGNKTPNINVGDNAVGITAADIVSDAP